jgi:hypothetical protein
MILGGMLGILLARLVHALVAPWAAMDHAARLVLTLIHCGNISLIQESQHQFFSLFYSIAMYSWSYY